MRSLRGSGKCRGGSRQPGRRLGEPRGVADPLDNAVGQLRERCPRVRRIKEHQPDVHAAFATGAQSEQLVRAAAQVVTHDARGSGRGDVAGMLELCREFRPTRAVMADAPAAAARRLLPDRPPRKVRKARARQ